MLIISATQPIRLRNGTVTSLQLQELQQNVSYRQTFWYSVNGCVPRLAWLAEIGGHSMVEISSTLYEQRTGRRSCVPDWARSDAAAGSTAST